MTPERKAWWDSLPKEEKRIRQIYRYTKKEILNFTDHDKKYVIKALRKQIAMRPVDNNGIVKCPVCREILYDKEFLIIKTLCCPDCGQKLRWE